MSVPTLIEYTPAKAQAEDGAIRRAALALGAVVFLAMTPVTMLVAPLKELVGERFGVGDGATHAFMAINLVGALAAMPLIGWLSDQRGRRRRIVAAALAMDGACLLSMAFAPTVEVLFAVRFVEGVAHILAISTLMAVAAGWAPPGRRGRVMGMVGACMMFGTTLGTPLGGWIYRETAGAGGPQGVFVAAAAVAGVAAVIAAALARESPSDLGVRAHVREVMGLVRANRALWIPYAYAFVDRLCVGVFITTFVIFLKDVHGLTPPERGVLIMAFLLPFAGLVYPAGRLVDRIGATWPVALGSGAFGIVFALYGAVPRSWLPAVMLCSGVLSAIMFAPTLTMCAEFSPAWQRGAAYTGFNLAGSLGMICGPILGGVSLAICRKVFDGPGAFEATFVITGLIEVACAAATLPLLLRHASRVGAAASTAVNS